MRKIQVSLAACLLTLMALLCAGCGGGSTPSPGGSSSRGAVAINLQFAPRPAGRSAAISKQRSAVGPATRVFGGNIPFGALSVQVTLTNPDTGAALATPRTVTAPSDVNGLKPLITIQYAALPIGPVRVDVSAYPSFDATGNVLATGSVTGQIVAIQTTTLSVPMAMRVARISVNPTQLTLSSDGGSATLTVAVLDANGQPLDLPLALIADDPDIAPITADPNDPTQALVTAGARGSTQITIYELNSEVSVKVPVVVQ